MVILGRQLLSSDIKFIQQLIQSNPSWNRTRIFKEICIHWDWPRPNPPTFNAAVLAEQSEHTLKVV